MEQKGAYCISDDLQFWMRAFGTIIITYCYSWIIFLFDLWQHFNNQSMCRQSVIPNTYNICIVTFLFYAVYYAFTMMIAIIMVIAHHTRSSRWRWPPPRSRSRWAARTVSSTVPRSTWWWWCRSSGRRLPRRSQKTVQKPAMACCCEVVRRGRHRGCQAKTPPPHLLWKSEQTSLNIVGTTTRLVVVRTWRTEDSWRHADTRRHTQTHAHAHTHTDKHLHTRTRARIYTKQPRVILWWWVITSFTSSDYFFKQTQKNGNKAFVPWAPTTYHPQHRRFTRGALHLLYAQREENDKTPVRRRNPCLSYSSVSSPWE